MLEKWLLLVTLKTAMPRLAALAAPSQRTTLRPCGCPYKIAATLYPFKASWKPLDHHELIGLGGPDVSSLSEM